MSRRDKHHTHTALMLLACAFAFVYLLAWQFQGSDIVRRWNGTSRPMITQTTPDREPLPAKLDEIKEDKTVSQSGTTTNISSQSPTTSVSTNISFTSLNAVPQSFMRLGISSPAGIMMDLQHIIVTNNTNMIKRSGESKTLTAEQIKQIGLTADSLTFYNDPSRANILVLMEITNNKQSILIQAPYAVYRDNKSHLNSLITQLTQK